MSTSDSPNDDELDLSLATGGPIYNRLVNMGLLVQGKANLRFRATIYVCLTWLPLVLLCLIQSRFIDVPLLSLFLHNFYESVRFVVVIPLLVLAEAQTRPWVTHVVRYFVKSGLVPKSEMLSYMQIILKSQKLRDSFYVEVFIIIFAFATSFLGFTPFRHSLAGTWHFQNGELTWAGLWFRYISVPLFRFACLNWFWRLIIWSYLLIRVSRLKLHLVATHPDQRCGLGFLASGHNNFAILAFALSCQAAAVMGEEILYHHQTLDQMKGNILLFIIGSTLVSIAPLLIFTPKLIERRRLGLYHYGILAKQSTDSYQNKWVKDEHSLIDESLEDELETDPKAQDSYKAVGSMQITVFDKNAITTFAIAAALPFAPLLLTIYRPDQLLDQVLKKLL